MRLFPDRRTYDHAVFWRGFRTGAVLVGLVALAAVRWLSTLPHGGPAAP